MYCQASMCAARRSDVGVHIIALLAGQMVTVARQTAPAAVKGRFFDAGWLMSLHRHVG